MIKAFLSIIFEIPSEVLRIWLLYHSPSCLPSVRRRKLFTMQFRELLFGPEAGGMAMEAHGLNCHFRNPVSLKEKTFFEDMHTASMCP